MNFLLSLLSGVISVLFFFTSIFSPVFGQKIKVKDADNVKLSFATISDTHINGSPARNTMLTHGFEVLSADGIDAIVHVGDMTDNGEKDEFDNLYECVRNGIDGPEFLPCVGNHDTWSDLGPEASYSYFVDYYNEYSGRNIEKNYYSTEINGYKIIVMSSEGDSTRADISQQQIDWLDKELADATKDGLPAFVICHWVIEGTNGEPQLWPEDATSRQSAEVEEVLQKYKNVFYFSGHIHSGFRGDLTYKTMGHASVETHGNIHCINLPSYMYFNADGGNLISGCGYIVEVYEDCVMLRARNYAMEHWMGIYDVTIDLV